MRGWDRTMKLPIFSAGQHFQAEVWNVGSYTVLARHLLPCLRKQVLITVVMWSAWAKPRTHRERDPVHFWQSTLAMGTSPFQAEECHPVLKNPGQGGGWSKERGKCAGSLGCGDCLWWLSCMVLQSSLGCTSLGKIMQIPVPLGKKVGKIPLEMLHLQPCWMRTKLWWNGLFESRAFGYINFHAIVL